MLPPFFLPCFHSSPSAPSLERQNVDFRECLIDEVQSFQPSVGPQDAIVTKEGLGWDSRS